MEINGFQNHSMISNGECNHHENDQETETWTMKKKRLVMEEQLYPAELYLNIRSAEGFGNPVALGRHYCVYYWVEPTQVFRTRIARAFMDNPIWNEYDVLTITNQASQCSGFVNLEVAKIDSDADPGPSSKVVIVGRARVPFPREPYHQIVGRFGLVRPNGKGQNAVAGHINVAMELRRLYGFTRAL